MKFVGMQNIYKCMEKAVVYKIQDQSNKHKKGRNNDISGENLMEDVTKWLKRNGFSCATQILKHCFLKNI